MPFLLWVLFKMDVFDFFRFDVSIQNSKSDEFGSRMGVEFVHDVPSVGGDGGGADIELLGYFLTWQSDGYSFEYFYFTTGQLLGSMGLIRYNGVGEMVEVPMPFLQHD